MASKFLVREPVWLDRGRATDAPSALSGTFPLPKSLADKWIAKQSDAGGVCGK